MKHASPLHGNGPPYPHDLLPGGAIPSRDLLQNNRETFLERGHLLPLPLPHAIHILSQNILLSFRNQVTTPALLSSAISWSSIPSWSRKTCVMPLIGRIDPFQYKTSSVCCPREGGGPLTRFSEPENLTAGPTSETSWLRPGWATFCWSPRC